jgi:hypothetical protein
LGRSKQCSYVHRKGADPETFANCAWQPTIGWTDIHLIDELTRDARSDRPYVSDPTEVHPSAPSRKPQGAETQTRMAYLDRVCAL